MITTLLTILGLLSIALLAGGLIGGFLVARHIVLTFIRRL